MRERWPPLALTRAIMWTWSCPAIPLQAPSAGRTYVAASGVPLLGLREAEAEPGLDADRWIATLALTRDQALRLIRAESVGAQVRLLAG